VPAGSKGWIHSAFVAHSNGLRMRIGAARLIGFQITLQARISLIQRNRLGSRLKA
jgi:hypothetical protein